MSTGDVCRSSRIRPHPRGRGFLEGRPRPVVLPSTPGFGALLSRLAASVPAKRTHTVRYAGVLASASKVRSRIVPIPPVPPALEDDDECKPKPSGCRYRTWAELLGTLGIDGLGVPEVRRPCACSFSCERATSDESSKPSARQPLLRREPRHVVLRSGRAERCGSAAAPMPRREDRAETVRGPLGRDLLLRAGFLCHKRC